ncbi:50S ribosomal protein L10 [bacterium]|nr:50S ribosomal protein L10 [bacterium]
MRAEKTFIIDELKQRYAGSSLVVFTTYQGIKANDMNTLRRSIAQASGTMDVVKNSLALRALADVKRGADDSMFAGPTAIASTSGDIVQLAKALAAFAKTNDKLQVRGGVLDDKQISAEEIKALSTLPSRDVLIAMLIGTLQAPMAGLVRVFSGLMGNMARVVGEVARVKGEAGGADAAPAAEAPAASQAQ